MIKLAALLLTCDLVNPYHERKDQKKKKNEGIMRKRSGGTGTRARKQGEEQPPNTARARRERGEENKIVQFGVTGESRSNNNTGNLSLSPLNSLPCAKIKKTTMK